MTNQEILDYILENGGKLTVTVKENVTVGTELIDDVITPVVEEHDFAYTILTQKEDITAKKLVLEAELAKITT